MQRVKLLVLFLFFIPFIQAQDQLPAPRQFCVFNNPPTTSCAFGENVVSGNVVLIGGSAATFSTPTDTLFTTYNPVVSVANAAYMWCGILASGGADTINGFPANADAIVIELPAMVGCTVDAFAHNSYSGTPATITCPSLTTTVNGDFIFSYVGTPGTNLTAIMSPNSPQLGFPGGNGGGGGGGAFESSYQVAGVNGSYNATYSSTGTNSGNCLIAAFKPAAITIVTTSLPTAANSVTYKYCLQAIGGTGAYTWSVSSGALPGGLSLNSSTGCISGTPTNPTTTPTFRVTDGTNSTTSALVMTVNSTVGIIGFINSAIVNTGSNTISMGTVASGTLIAVGVNQQNSGASHGNSSSFPTDTLGTNFKLVTMFEYRTIWHSIWVGKATSTGADTITVVDSSFDHVDATAAQFSNAQVIVDVMGETTGTNVGAATLTGPSLITLVPNSELWLSVSGSGGDSSWNAGSGYTIETLSGQSAPMNAEHGSQSTVGTYTPTFSQTANSSGDWIIEGLALRPATSVPFVGNTKRHGVIF